MIGVVRELRRRGGDPRPLSVAGARELVPILARELRAGGEASGGRREHPRERLGARVGGRARRRASSSKADQAGVPIVAVTDADDVPYVLATSIVRVPPGQGFPVDEIARAVADKLGEDGTALAARLPVVRGAVCAHLIASFSKRNAIVAGAVFIPGVDMPILTLNQARLVLQDRARLRRDDRQPACARTARCRRGRLRLPCGCTRAARFRPGRRVGPEGVRRLRRHEGGRRGRRAVLRSAPLARRLTAGTGCRTIYLVN